MRYNARKFANAMNDLIEEHTDHIEELEGQRALAHAAIMNTLPDSYKEIVQVESRATRYGEKIQIKKRV